MILVALWLFAQTTDVVHPCPAWTGATASGVGPNINAPKLVRSIEPVFTEEAHAAHVSASRLAMEIVVSEVGQVCDIRLISPLGFGLDQAAIEAVREWQFRPATYNGTPIRFKVKIEISFLTPGNRVHPDEVSRIEFNLAISKYSSGERKQLAESIQAIERLSARKYPPAEAFLGYLLYLGENVSQDPKRAVELITHAYKKKAPFALFAMGLLLAEGRAIPADYDKALKLMKAAAAANVPAAHKWLAEHATANRP